jgi:hypothetical protein
VLIAAFKITLSKVPLNSRELFTCIFTFKYSFIWSSYVNVLESEMLFGPQNPLLRVSIHVLKPDKGKVFVDLRFAFGQDAGYCEGLSWFISVLQDKCQDSAWIVPWRVSSQQYVIHYWLIFLLYDAVQYIYRQLIKWTIQKNKDWQRNIYLSTYLSIYLWLYGPLLDLGRFFSFLSLHIVGRTTSTEDQPVARPLPAHRTAQTPNKCTQPSIP